MSDIPPYRFFSQLIFHHLLLFLKSDLKGFYPHQVLYAYVFSIQITITIEDVNFISHSG